MSTFETFETLFAAEKKISGCIDRLSQGKESKVVAATLSTLIADIMVEFDRVFPTPFTSLSVDEMALSLRISTLATRLARAVRKVE